MIRILLPLREPFAEVAERLKGEPKAPVLVEIPEGWCYRIQRSAPPGGWRSPLVRALRPGLFPEPLESLTWDEEVGEDGTWNVWAVSATRVVAGLGPLAESVYRPGRPVRVRPAGEGEEGLSAFPNLAPDAFRPRRVPWRRLRHLASRFGPGLAALLLVSGAGLYLQRGWTSLAGRLRAEEEAVQRMDRQAQADRQMIAVLRGHASLTRQEPSWLIDLDALTRLLPEDTRLVKLGWEPKSLQLDLLTPHPERIQEILEASPEFKGVRFVGNLDRQGEISRLTLQGLSEGER